MAHLILLPITLLAATVAAQTYTDCNPLNTTTCPADPALGTTYATTYNVSQTQLDPHFFNVTAGEQLIKMGNNGAELTISETGQSVTAQTSFYIMWGTVEIIMQAAAGVGIISTFDLLSDDLDEIDLEIMGGNTTTVESNWYGWGNTSQHNALYHPLSGPQQSMHNYTINWSQEQIEWIFDGNTARSLPYAAPGMYPQTPSYLKFGIWAGGDASEPEGTRVWAGGLTDWSKGPFTMTIQSIKVTDGSTNVTSYLYGDKSGNYQSIKSTPGESVAYKQLNKASAVEHAQQQWHGLSTNAKIGIAAGVGGAFVLLILVYTVVCITQRKRGRAEKAIADREWDAQHNELMEYRNRMKRGDFAIQHMGHGEKF